MTEDVGGLRRVVAALRRHHGRPEPLPATDPFELILWENVAYLAAPQRRRDAFELLRRTIGTSPAAVLAASPQALARITRHGIRGTSSVDKLRACAAIAMETFGGSLDEVVRGPLEQAKRTLRAFPSIGEPGAEKVLLFSGRAPLLAPDSNALRVLVPPWPRARGALVRTHLCGGASARRGAWGPSRGRPGSAPAPPDPRTNALP